VPNTLEGLEDVEVRIVAKETQNIGSVWAKVYGLILKRLKENLAKIEGKL